MGTYGYQLVETQGDPEVWRRVQSMHKGHQTRRDYEYVSPPFTQGQTPPPWLWVFGNPSIAEAPSVEQGLAICLYWQTNVDHVRLSVYRDGTCIRSLEHCREMDPAWMRIEGQRQPWEAQFLLGDVDRTDLTVAQCSALDAALASGDWSAAADLAWPTSTSWLAVADALGVVRLPDDRVAHLLGPQPGALQRLRGWFQGG